ncbi:MAG: YncE family protein [Gemmatimonadota bacterium]|nr:YncE family protein [Gemmatimonadota bacterium]
MRTNPLTLAPLAAVPMVIALAAGPAAARQAEPALVVLNKAAAEAVLVDPATRAVFAVLPTGEGPHEVALSPDGDRAYVTDYGVRDAPGHTITVLDLAEREATATWDLGTYTRPHGIAVDEAGSVVWVTAEGAEAVLELDTGSGEILRVWRTDQRVSHMLAPTPDEEKLYVANIGSGTVSVIDRSTDEVTTIETGEGAEGIDVSPDGEEVWVTNRGENTISVIDVATDEVIAGLESGGEMPIRIKFTPDGAEAWVSNARSGTVSVFDAETRERIALLPVGAAPVGILVTPDGGHVFVANTRDDRVTIFDAETLERVGSFAPGDEPDGMAWSPSVPGPREPAREEAEPAMPPADPADVASVDAIVAALYDAISGPAGPRDWDRLRSLFVPGGLLVPAFPEAGAPRSLDVEEYIAVAGPQLAERAFYESETARTIHRFGNVAVVMSGYASRTAPDGEPFSRGVNAITLVDEGERWAVVSIAWDVEREGNPLPEEYR